MANGAIVNQFNRLYAKLNDVIRTANAEINHVKKLSDTKKALFTAQYQLYRQQTPL